MRYFRLAVGGYGTAAGTFGLLSLLWDSSTPWWASALALVLGLSVLALALTEHDHA